MNFFLLLFSLMELFLILLILPFTFSIAPCILPRQDYLGMNQTCLFSSLCPMLLEQLEIPTSSNYRPSSLLFLMDIIVVEKTAICVEDSQMPLVIMKTL